ncbi:MAG TPA: type II secretion system protein [Bacillales bacterium]|nr:type II secretion system protein [Bacillales bacterium]
MKKGNGFSLVETMAALFVLTIVVAGTIPVVTKLYEERAAAHEKARALNLLENELHRWLLIGKIKKHHDIKRGSVMYHVHSNGIDNGNALTVCIRWKASNERRYESCGSAKMNPALRSLNR